jgi:predicted small lipoprotein YifL
LYGAARIGEFVVTYNFSPRSSGWAIILLSAAVLALAGCGRKGPLDLPPHAAAPPPAATAQGDTEAEQAAKPNLFNSTGTDTPAAAKGAKRPFVLDPLLDSH